MHFSQKKFKQKLVKLKKLTKKHHKKAEFTLPLEAPRMLLYLELHEFALGFLRKKLKFKDDI